MLRKLIALAVSTTLLAIAVNIYGSGIAQSDDVIETRTLTVQAQEAIARGDSEVNGSLNIDFNEAASLDDALARDTLVVATPLLKRSFVVNDSFIDTWYKFKVNEFLQQRPLYRAVENPPAEMLPLAADEFLLVVPGGEQFVGGVSFNFTVADFPSFQTSQKYLLFINYDPATKAATIGGGPTAAYMVTSPDNLAAVYVDGDGIPIGSPVADGLAARFNNSLNLLRSALGPVTVDPSAYYNLVVQHSGKCLDVANASYSNGAQLIQFDCHGGSNQKWRFEATGDGFYRIIAGHSGKCLDVSQGSLADGAQIIQHDCHGGTNQQWAIAAAGSGYNVLAARNSGKVPSIAGVSYNNAASVLQWYYDSAAHQKWQFAPAGSAPPPPPPPSCDPVQEQNCYNSGGSWDPVSCYCEPYNSCGGSPWYCY